MAGRNIGRTMIEPPDPPVDAATAPSAKPALRHGREVLAAALATLPSAPGVYRMADKNGAVLYVGKAKNLKKRVSAYANRSGHSLRIQRMIAATQSLEIVTTHTEVEALLLESNLIKKLKPRFNILLRDDKSFPYIMIRRDHEWAQIAKHRGTRNRKAEFFGPFASAGAVNRTLSALQRAFPLRSCSDSVFESRTRPCLQFQIKRCTAPCVDRITREDYEQIVDQARNFLMGRSQEIQQHMSRSMQIAAETRDYETAAVFRDRIRALTQIQARQDINVQAVPEADVVAMHLDAGLACIQIFFFRAGQNFGNRAYFPAHTQNADAEEILGAFIGQFYAARQPPRLILMSHPLDRIDLIEEALAIRAGNRVKVEHPQRGAKADLVAHAADNAREALRRRLAESATQRKLLDGLARAFRLDGPPSRIEVYDNSHIMGTNAVGAMVVAGPEGFAKGSYRKFNIKRTDLSPGDDFGMMTEVLTRRFKRLLSEDAARESGNWPDLVLVDGGGGQMTAAKAVFADLGVTGVVLAAVAKGPDRNAGRERVFLADGTELTLDERDPVLYFIQRLRDEAHRFAIGSHRQKRSKAIGASPLDEVAGIGAKRKRALLHHFGSAGEVARAGLADLERVDGISKTVAKLIYDHFHAEG
ncbi:MAG: excinuclease ABC subunit UvrC [Alphaproteobacteria bacterium]|nr:excinuclease ABC subunit UvrC [Alphaproteobacteria bacterium]